MSDRARFPEDLTSRRQWICWRMERTRKTDKPTKTPYDPHTGRRASSIDPATWGTLDEARSAYEKYGYSGIGFVFVKNDDIVGVDIDHCLDKATGTLNETAAAIIGRCATYTEVSPSGEGVHLFFHGIVPEGGNKNSGTGVEMYAHSRYFTMTGNRLGDAPMTISRDTDALAWIHATYVEKPKPQKPLKKQSSAAKPKSRSRTGPLSDEDVLAKALATDKDTLFPKLWNGQWQDSYETQSEADMALVCKLAFWTGKDRAQMDRLFRQSALFREKWDARHHANGATYGEETLSKAVELVVDAYSPMSGAPILEFEGRYLRSRDDKIAPLTNFVVKPCEMIIAEDETQLICDLITVRGEVFHHTFQSTDFANLQRFKTNLNQHTISLSYTGSEGDLELLKNFLSEMEWERKKGVRASGLYFHDKRWVFVSSIGAIDADGKPVTDILQLDKENNKPVPILDAFKLTKERLLELGPLLLSFNESAKTVSVIAWCAGCFLKQHLKAANVKFPHLFLIGEAGSGKSTTLENVIMPIFSMTHIVAAPQVSGFAVMKESSLSNIFPQALDEFKPSRISKNLDVLLNHMRTVYDGQEGIRGRADQTVRKYELAAPLIVAGEESPSEAAIRERSIELLFSKRDLKERGYSLALQKLKSKPELLRSLGRALLETALTIATKEVSDWYQTAETIYDPAMPARVVNNLAAATVGLMLIDRLCSRHALQWTEVFDVPLDACFRYLAYAAKEYLLEGNVTNKGVVEQTLEVMARMGLSSDEWRVLKNLDHVAINVKKCYDRYTRYRRECAITGECLSQAEFIQQLRHSDLFVEYTPVRFANGQWRAYVLDFVEIKKRCNIDSFDLSASDLVTPWD